MLWNEISMTTQAVACSLDVHDDGVMEETIQQSGRHDGISKDFTPLCKAAVGGQDHRAFFIARVNELEEQIGATLRDWEVSDLIDNQQ